MEFERGRWESPSTLARKTSREQVSLSFPCTGRGQRAPTTWRRVQPGGGRPRDLCKTVGNNFPIDYREITLPRVKPLRLRGCVISSWSTLVARGLHSHLPLSLVFNQVPFLCHD